LLKNSLLKNSSLKIVSGKIVYYGKIIIGISKPIKICQPVVVFFSTQFPTVFITVIGILSVSGTCILYAVCPIYRLVRFQTVVCSNTRASSLRSLEIRIYLVCSLPNELNNTRAGTRFLEYHELLYKMRFNFWLGRQVYKI